MFTKSNRFVYLFSILSILAILFSSVRPLSVYAQSGDDIKRQVNIKSGRLSLIGPASGRVLAASRALGTSLRPQDPAMALAQHFAPEFGLQNPERNLSQISSERAENGRLAVRYQQKYEDIPVMGAELIVNTNDNGDLYSMNGEVAPDLSLQTQPTIDPDQARDTALQVMAKWYEKSTEDFVVTEPELWIYDESLLQPSTRPVELVWRLELTARNTGMPVRELVLVNAQRGTISLHFNQIDSAWASQNKKTETHDNTGPTIKLLQASTDSNNSYLVRDTVARLVGSIGLQLFNGVQIKTYTAGGSSNLPGSLVCTEANPNCDWGDAHTQGAHKYAIGTYNLYSTEFSRNSIDNNGMTITSTVHYCDPYDGCPYDNAFWNGIQMVYGDARDWPLADDVVAHELTHGVTQHESNLFYYYQSGAINESLSDVFGEYYDQTDGLGNDGGSFDWLVSEDAIAGGNGAIRSMSNPPAFGDPDKMSSPYYYLGDGDGGGVHYNSGINNKAVYLMVDGDTFNTKTVTGLGWEKVGAIYYEAQANLLTSGADYSDLYYILQQACSNLIGQKGITSADCTEVKDALDAVEMNGQLPGNFSSDAPICSVAGTVPNIIFADDLENGTGNWTFNNGDYTRWQVDSAYYGPYAQSGLHSLYAADSPAAITDATARLTPIVIPANAYLHFAQAYDFEKSDANYDGGVLEYSTNNGTSWQDAGSLIQYNGYTGTIYPSGSSPLSGRSAFVAASHGYISTRVNLSSLVGQSVSFRWRMGLDPFVASGGWWVDNIKVYTCSADPIPANDDFPNATPINTVPYKDTLKTTAATDRSDDPQVNLSCDGKLLAKGQKTVWYKYIPSSTRSVSLDTLGTPYNTYIAVWIGSSPNNLALVICDDDAANGLQSQVSFNAQAGTPYYIEIAGYTGIQGTPPVNNFGGTLQFHVTSFADVAGNYWAWPYIEGLYSAGVTSGCGVNPLMYCPTTTVTRDQMAVFLLKAKHGSGYVPPTPSDVFFDVPTNYWAAAWIEQLAAEGVTAGCSLSPLMYCPTTTVTRDQMAVFLLKAKHGSGYVPPTPTGVFSDVPTNYWAAAWIEQLAAEGVTAGCGGGNYCPTTPVSRDQMAVFLDKTFGLPAVP